MTLRPAYRIDGDEVPREAFYAVACDPRRSVVVEACAGAGKTWMLVSRILRALLEGAEPHEILAITFTRKAAGEMRARLDEWLAEFAAPTCSEARRIQALRDRGLDAAQAAQLAPALAGLHERVLQAARPVEVRTFHAWFSQLLRAAPLELLAELGLQPQMELVESTQDHEPEVFRRFHAAVLREPSLRADFEAVVRQRGRSQLRKWLAAAWQRRIEIEFADAAGTLDASVPSASALWPACAAFVRPSERLQTLPVRGLLSELAAALGRHRLATCRKHGQALADALVLSDADALFAAAKAALFTDKGEPRKVLEAPQLADAIGLLREVDEAVTQQAAHEEHLRLARLARALLAEYAQYKRQRGLADMSDLERCALALLRDNELSGWVQERLDMRVRHLLIDEFQDTSPLQWHALHAWLSAYAGAGGGASGQRAPGVFIVGDPKQSIYRFRRAEPRVFEAAREFVQLGLDGHVLACDHTRRNAPEVLAALNSVFSEAQASQEFTGFRPHTTELAPTGAAAVLALERMPRTARAAAGDDGSNWRDSLRTPRLLPEEEQREREAAQVADAVAALVRDGVAPGEVQVLCRKRESLRLVAAQLAARHLPFAAPEDFALVESPEVRDLVALLDVLASPQHKLSLAQALRSPVFGASDDDLLALSTAAAGHGDWWRALMEAEVASPALARARMLLARWQALAARLPPHDLLDAIVAEGEVRERVAAAVPAPQRHGALGAIDALLATALTLDGARYATPYGFVRALRRREVTVPAAGEREAVQLLTVHGAKGLEARVVFVMDADPEPKNADTATLLVDWPVDSPHPRRCAFVYAESRCAPSLAALLESEQQARQREELNGLYVAMSRAKERLVFSATEPHGSPKRPSWWARIEPLATPWRPEAPPAASASAVPVTLAVLPDWQAPAAAPRAAAPAVTDDAASRLGQAVHRVLEWAAAASAPDLRAMATAAARAFATDAAETERLAARIWHSRDCQRFFRGEALLWAGNEVPVAEGGDDLRIDRLVQLREGGEAVWWVLDYKLQHTPQALEVYREQLRRYARAVQRLQPGETVRAAFITGRGEVVEAGGA